MPGEIDLFSNRQPGVDRKMPYTDPSPIDLFNVKSKEDVKSGVLKEGLDTAKGYITKTLANPDPVPAVSDGGSGHHPKVDYLYADLAQHYKMNNATAYQEALANTAHAREIEDLQRAGLNPVLSAKYGGADVFAGQDMSYGSSGGGSYTGGGKAAAANKKGISWSSIAGGVGLIASGFAGWVAYKASKSPAIGAIASKAAGDATKKIFDGIAGGLKGFGF